MNFWDTNAGYKFAQHTVPQLIKAMNRLAEQMEKANDAARVETSSKEDGMMCKLLKFAEMEDFNAAVVLTQLKALWTAYCVFKDYEPDTAAYDGDVMHLWDAMLKNSTNPFKDFASFDSYMGMDLA